MVTGQKESRYLTTGAAAKRIGVSRHTIMRAVRRGKIHPALKTPGGRLRFRWEDIEAFAQQLTQEAANVTLAAPDTEPPTPDLNADRTSADIALPERAPSPYDAYVEAFFQVPAPIALLDLSGIFLLVNPAFCELLGFEQSELLMTSSADLTHPEDVENPREPEEALRAVKRLTAQFEKRYRRRDDQYVWVDVTASLVSNEQGEPLYFVNQMQDITEQRHADELRRASEERLRSVVTNAPVALLAIDSLGTVTVAEGSALPALGFSPIELVGRSIFDAYRSRPDMLELARQAMAGKSVTAVLAMGNAVLDSRWVPLRDDPVKITGAISISTDITVQKLAEQALVESGNRARALIENAPVGACIVDDQDRFEVVNAAYADIYGFSPAEMLGQDVGWIKGQVKERPIIVNGQDAERPMSGLTATEEYELVNKQGLFLIISSTNLTISGADGRPKRASFVMDITDQKRNEQRLSYAANHDILTGLPNRALFYDRLEHALQVAARERTGLAVFQIDLDRFKAINDHYGHATGDVVLHTVAKRISDVVRASDTVARLGGDEFAVILPQSDEAGALQVAGKIRTAVIPPIQLPGAEISVGASIGISLYPEHASDATSLVHYADRAMYMAKAAGGGATVHSPGQIQVAGGHTLAEQQREAIKRGQLRLLYQPVLNRREEHITHVEALVRWQQPALDLLDPGQFITLAEQTGAISGLTLWVLEEALRQIGTWHHEGMCFDVSANISMRVLLDYQFADLVSALLREYAVVPAQLTIEITESRLLRDSERAIVAIKRLAALGVRISLDDVGAHSSSFDVICRLPLSEMKIARSIVRRLSAGHGPAVVTALLGLGQALGLKIVAKGVEDRSTWEQLSALGCAVMQGYYLSRPLPGDQLITWVRARELVAAQAGR